MCGDDNICLCRYVAPNCNIEKCNSNDYFHIVGSDISQKTKIKNNNLPQDFFFQLPFDLF